MTEGAGKVEFILLGSGFNAGEQGKAANPFQAQRVDQISMMGG